MNCVACGKRYGGKGRFCPFCGVSLRLACSHCGQLNSRARRDCSRCGAALGEREQPAAEAMATAPSRPLERRQLTIMFTDLVNSTALSDRLDPEDFCVLIEAHRTVATAPIRRYGGVVARYLGDGMLVYFGYPNAHEDDPDRAVRAGLEVVQATKAMNQRWVGEGRGKIAVRIGIHTGIVVVGDVIKPDVQEPMAVFGNPPSMAARLQALAEPNSVVLSDVTRWLLRPTVRCAPRGETTLKGIARPVEVFTASEFDGPAIGDPLTARARETVPFVDRRKELLALERGWVSAKEGRGRAFLLEGDPGIGKSRLIRALEEKVSADPSRWLVARTSPYATNSDFFAFSELFHRLLQPSAAGSGSTSGYELLEATLASQGVNDPNHVLGFASLLGLTIKEGAAKAGLQPERLRELTLDAIAGWLERQSATQPLALVIEDLHWADASMLEAIRLLLTRLERARLLLVMSSRERDALGEAPAHVRLLSIDRLPQTHAKTLLGHVVHDAGLSKASLDTLLERADGVPLYLEELPKPVLESGGPGSVAGLTTGGDPIALPATLRDSLMAQLDRMGEGKIVAQTAAVLGHSFDEPLLRRVYGGDLRSLEEGLQTLVDTGLLNRRGDAVDSVYEFKHALLAEIAYDSLLRQQRRQIHRRAADALVAHFRPIAEARPELVARHYAAADDAIVAFDYWMQAGKAAARRSANSEAIGHLRSAEAELERLKAKGSKDLEERWLALYLTRGPVLTALSGWSTPEVEETYRAILALSESDDGQLEDQFDAWIGLCNVYLLKGDLTKARAATDRMHAIAMKTGKKRLLQRWHRPTGFCDFLSGRFKEAVQHYGATLPSEDMGRTHSASGQGRENGSSNYSTTNREVMSYSMKAWSHWFLGQGDEAEYASSLAIRAAERAEHPFSKGFALCLTASLEQCRGSASTAMAHAEEALVLSAEYNFPYWLAWGKVIKGWAMAKSGDLGEGIRFLSEGIAGYEANDAVQMKGYNLCLLADVYQMAGRWRDAVDAARLALAEMKRTGIIFYQVEAYRLLGEGLFELDTRRTLRLRMLTKALRLAEKQASFPLSLRVSCSLLRQCADPRLQKVVQARAAKVLQSARAYCPSLELAAAEKQLQDLLAVRRSFPD